MNFLQLKTRTALRLGNMQTSDPFYSYIDEFVNSAVNAVLLRTVSRKRKSFNMFPEASERWTNITLVDQSHLDLPSNLLVLERVYSFDATAVPDLDDDTARLVAEVPKAKFDILPRDTTITGYPSLWMRDGNRVYLYPTPRTGYTTYVLLRGYKKNADMSADGDEPFLDELWHDAILHYACYLGELEMNHPDEAKKWLEACDLALMQTADIMGLENASGDNSVKIEGDPTRA